MIFGIGIDIVEVGRIRRGLERFGERYARRILNEREYGEYVSLQRPPRFVAMRYAAKEAFAKALGTGFADGLSLRDVGVGHDRLGRPVLQCTGRVLERLERCAIGGSHLSLSDETGYALAFVTLERAGCDPAS